MAKQKATAVVPPAWNRPQRDSAQVPARPAEDEGFIRVNLAQMPPEQLIRHVQREFGVRLDDSLPPQSLREAALRVIGAPLPRY